ncbi:MAG: FMN-binding negative transcriptional regulator [Paucibacter sp.]|nr:FMN-binding negative transcriptional regulator [Roseateles sp.]
MNDAALAAKLIAENPLATLIGPDERGHPFVSHLPMCLVDEDDGWSLEGHMARANPHWGWLCAQGELLAVFTGPDAYISPRHYDTRLSVPTWNYVAVHVRGRFELVDEIEAKEQVLKRLIAQHDPEYNAQWTELPEDYKLNLLKAIVGFRIRVDRWEAKAKLSQNRAATERERIRSASTPEMRGWLDLMA